MESDKAIFVDFGTQDVILGDSIIHSALLSTLYVLNSGDEHHCHPLSTNSGGRVPPFTYYLRL